MVAAQPRIVAAGYVPSLLGLLRVLRRVVPSLHVRERVRGHQSGNERRAMSGSEYC